MRIQLCPLQFTRTNSVHANSPGPASSSTPELPPNKSTRATRCKCGCVIPRRRRCWEELMRRLVVFRSRRTYFPRQRKQTGVKVPPDRSEHHINVTGTATTGTSVTLNGSMFSLGTTANMNVVCLRPSTEVTVTLSSTADLLELGVRPTAPPKHKSRKSKSPAVSGKPPRIRRLNHDDPDYDDLHDELAHTLKRQRAFENVRDASSEGFLLPCKDMDASGEAELFELKELMAPALWKD